MCALPLRPEQATQPSLSVALEMIQCFLCVYIPMYSPLQIQERIARSVPVEEPALERKDLFVCTSDSTESRCTRSRR